MHSPRVNSGRIWKQPPIMRGLASVWAQVTHDAANALPFFFGEARTNAVPPLYRPPQKEIALIFQSLDDFEVAGNSLLLSGKDIFKENPSIVDLYHLESRWRNSHVLVYRDPLLSHLWGVPGGLAIYFHHVEKGGPSIWPLLAGGSKGSHDRFCGREKWAPGNYAGDLFGMLKRPLQMVKWPATIGDEQVTWNHRVKGIGIFADPWLVDVDFQGK